MFSFWQELCWRLCASFTYFSPVLLFIKKTVIGFAIQIKYWIGMGSTEYSCNHWSWYRCIFEREFIIVNSNFYFIQFFVLWELFSTTPIPREMSSFFEIFPLTWVSHKKTWPYIINISYSTTKNRKTKAITTNNEELHLLKLSHEPEFYSPSLSWRCL